MKQSSPPRRNFHNDFVFSLWKEILSQQRIRHLDLREYTFRHFAYEVCIISSYSRETTYSKRFWFL